MNRKAARIKKGFFILGVLVLSLVSASCGGTQAGSPVTPTADKLTFLYFYTDN